MALDNLHGKIILTTNIADVTKDISNQLKNIKVSSLNIIAKDQNSRIAVFSENLKKVGVILTKLHGISSLVATDFRHMSSALRDMSKAFGTVATATTKTTTKVKEVREELKDAGSVMQHFGDQAGIAAKRYTAFSIAVGLGFSALRAAKTAIQESVVFQDKLVKISQVSGKALGELKPLSQEITRLSTTLGVSSSAIQDAALTLTQAGESSRSTKKALEALAKVELAPSFGNIKDATEAAIAVMHQFGTTTDDLSKQLSAINAVSAEFAVEAEDIVVAIQRAGASFGQLAKDSENPKEALNEFIALFTSVRQTTRESAETIATGLRTIFTRLQRASTLQFFKNMNIDLQDARGRFIGLLPAITKISQAIQGIPATDSRIARIGEELGGFRQINKTIPLLTQLSVTQEALNVAKQQSNSLDEAAAKAQESLIVQLHKVEERFLALFRSIGESSSFQVLFKSFIFGANTAITLANALKPLVPLLTAITAIKGLQAFSEFAPAFRKRITSSAHNFMDVQNAPKPDKLNLSPFIKRAAGGIVPGAGNTDSVLAALTPGEQVVDKRTSQRLGPNFFRALKHYSKGSSDTGGVYHGNIPIPAASTSFTNKNYFTSPDDARKSFNKALSEFIGVFHELADELRKIKFSGAKDIPAGKNDIGLYRPFSDNGKGGYEKKVFARYHASNDSVILHELMHALDNVLADHITKKTGTRTHTFDSNRPGSPLNEYSKVKLVGLHEALKETFPEPDHEKYIKYRTSNVELLPHFIENLNDTQRLGFLKDIHQSYFGSGAPIGTTPPTSPSGPTNMGPGRRQRRITGPTGYPKGLPYYPERDFTPKQRLLGYEPPRIFGGPTDKVYYGHANGNINLSPNGLAPGNQSEHYTTDLRDYYKQHSATGGFRSRSLRFLQRTGVIGGIQNAYGAVKSGIQGFKDSNNNLSQILLGNQAATTRLHKFGRFLNRDGFAMGAGLASLASNQALGSVAENKKEHRGRGIAGEALTGLFGGAATGAVLGSTVPGVGTALGAVTGGLAGFASALKSATDEARNLDLSDAIEKALTDSEGGMSSLSNVNKALNTATAFDASNAQTYKTGIKANIFAGALQGASLKELFSGEYLNSVASADQREARENYQKTHAKDITTIAERDVKTLVGKKNFASFKDFSKSKEGQELRRSIEQATGLGGEGVTRLIKKAGGFTQNKRADLIEDEIDTTVHYFKKFADAMESAQVAAKGFSNALELSESALGGRVGVAHLADRSDLIKNPTGATFGQTAQELDDLLGKKNSTGSKFAAFVGANQFDIAKAIKQGGNADNAGGVVDSFHDVFDAITKNFTNQFGSGGDFESIRSNIYDKAREAIGGFKGTESISDIQKALGNSFQPLLDAQAEIAKLDKQNKNDFINTMSRVTESLVGVSEKRFGASNTFDEATNKEMEFRGGGISVTNVSSYNKLQAQLAGRGGLGGAAAFSPQAILEELNATEQEKRRLSVEGGSKEQFAAANSKSQALIAALDNLTKATNVNSSIEKQLADLNNKRDQGLSLDARFRGGDSKERQEIMREGQLAELLNRDALDLNSLNPEDFRRLQRGVSDRSLINPGLAKKLADQQIAQGGFNALSPEEDRQRLANEAAIVANTRRAGMAQNAQASFIEGQAGVAANAAVQKFELVNAPLLGEFSKKFDEAVNKLNAMPREFTMVGNHKVEVVINGAEAFAKMQDSISDLVQTRIQGAMNQLISNLKAPAPAGPGLPNLRNV